MPIMRLPQKMNAKKRKLNAKKLHKMPVLWWIKPLIISDNVLFLPTKRARIKNSKKIIFSIFLHVLGFMIMHDISNNYIESMTRRRATSMTSSHFHLSIIIQARNRYFSLSPICKNAWRNKARNKCFIFAAWCIISADKKCFDDTFQ